MCRSYNNITQQLKYLSTLCDTEAGVPFDPSQLLCSKIAKAYKFNFSCWNSTSSIISSLQCVHLFESASSCDTSFFTDPLTCVVMALARVCRVSDVFTEHSSGGDLYLKQGAAEDEF